MEILLYVLPVVVVAITVVVVLYGRAKGDGQRQEAAPSALSSLSQEIEEFLAPPPAPASQQRVPLPDGNQVSRYKILDLLDEGGMGCVYRVQDDQGRDFALKIPNWHALHSARSVQRFQREIDISLKLNDPCIIRTVDAGFYEADGVQVPYMVMERVEGQPLDGWIERQKHAQAVPDIAFAIRIGRQVAQALTAFHDQGVIHRDIKPGNIMLNSAGEVKVLDFGIARAVHSKTLTVRGLVLGTPEYLAPEQSTSSHEVDDRADLYSLGVLLFAMTTWHVPFEEEDIYRCVSRKRVEVAPSPRTLNPSVPHELETIILKLLQREAKHRYQTAREVQTLLRMLESHPIGG